MIRAGRLIETSAAARSLVRAVARLVNPLVLLIAGRRWMPILGVVHHTGRRSGRPYSTPLGMRPLGDGFVVPRTFGPDAAWYRNLVAAGSARVTYRGRTATVLSPLGLSRAEVSAAYPRYERAMFALLGIDDFVRVQAAGQAVLSDPEAWPRHS